MAAETVVTKLSKLPTLTLNKNLSVSSPRRGAGARRLKGRERRAAARAAVEIVDTSEEAVNVNKTTTT